MILLTDELRAQLLANGRLRDTDHVPVVKFFNPLGEGVWLATELDADGDTLFGLADLGEPELGYFSLEEMIAVRLPFGLGIERDILFTGDFPISVWAKAAREAGSIRRWHRPEPYGDTSRKRAAFLLVVVGPDLDRLRRKIDRQEETILALRRIYGVNEERPQCFD